MIKNSEQNIILLSGYSLQKVKNQLVVKPPLAAIQAEIRRGIDSIRSLMTPVEDPAIVFASAQLILLYLGTAAVAFPASRHALLAKDLVTWQAMVGRHILEDIVGRVAQYVDEHYPVDKWHLGDLIAWVAQSALKYRPRICELSKCS
ncbi:hypothetical protein TNCV_4411521 [Trichonephila clavipes]|nr:hypothetical protein TNCV_4411521 [Trichonephila clavipes]